MYHQIRYNLSDELKCHLMLHQFSYAMTHPHLAKEMGIYLRKSFLIRNPEKRSDYINNSGHLDIYKMNLLVGTIINRHII